MSSAVMLQIQRKCRICGKVRTVEMSEEAFEMWTLGTLIQDAAPEMSVDDRELLISSICGPCFDDMFGEEE